MKKILQLLTLFVFIWSCNNDEIGYTDFLDQRLAETLDEVSNGQGRDFFTMPSSDDYNGIPQDPKNLITEEKVILGKLLYHETGLALEAKKESGMGTFSCASCHFAGAGFQANRHQGLSDGAVGFGFNGEGRFRSEEYEEEEMDVQPVKTPTAMNGAYQELMLWNGQFGAAGDNIGTEAQWKEGTPIANNHLGYEGLETQAIAGLAVHRLVIDSNFLKENGYDVLFAKAFPNVRSERPYTREYAGLAIAAYERTILSNEAPFQQWLKGNEMAMSTMEKEGAILFFDKAKCGNCHTGPALNSMTFSAFGMNDLHDCDEPTFMTGPELAANLGRGGFTKNPADNYKFKVPQLYNLTDSPFLGHGSTFRTVRSLVNYKNRGIPENPEATNLAPEFKPLFLTDEEVDLITLFIEKSLYDSNLNRYVPEEVLSGQCFPNNDPISKIDLGCE